VSLPQKIQELFDEKSSLDNREFVNTDDVDKEPGKFFQKSSINAFYNSICISEVSGVASGDCFCNFLAALKGKNK
jgi:hypothetical protein